MRSAWLRENGFYHAYGIYYHLDGRIAGLFDKKVDDEGNGTPTSATVYDNCCNPLQKTADMWDSLLGVST